jgi:hypothetical protein
VTLIAIKTTVPAMAGKSQSAMTIRVWSVFLASQAEPRKMAMERPPWAMLSSWV